MKNIVVAYTPVLHNGYIEFFKKHKGSILAIWGQEIIRGFDWLARKDIRAIDPEIMQEVVSSLNIFSEVLLLDQSLIERIRAERLNVIMPDEEESHAVSETYLEGVSVQFENVFLRWDRSRSIKSMEVDSEEISVSELDRRFMKEAFGEATKSSDWWRQVGAVLVVESEAVFTAFNRHTPSHLTPCVLGDPRSFFKKGLHTEVMTAEHAEASIVAQAAREGISTKGSSIYVTTFPCPLCAKLIASSGIAVCYFSEGYAVLDGEDVLKRAGVKIVRVLLEHPQSK